MSSSVSSTNIPSFSILIDDRDPGYEFRVVYLITQNEINRVPYSRILLDDGDPSKANFPLSEDDILAPGKEVEIKMGYQGREKSVFKGVLISQKIKVGKGRAGLWLEMRDKAFKMTLVKKNKLFLDKTDSDIAGELIDAYGLSKKCESSGVKYPQLVQWQTSDWDFLRSRAKAASQLIFVNDGTVELKKPELRGKSVLTLTYGTDIIELEAEFDVRSQIQEATAQSWDYANQKLAEGKSAEPGLNSQGNIKPTDMAAAADKPSPVRGHADKLADDELKARADGELLKSRLSIFCGRATCEGNSDVQPGDLIKLDGLGKRFNGDAYVSAVRHEFSRGDWTTDIQFGLNSEWFIAGHDPEKADDYLLDGKISGLQIATVKKISSDPDGEDRIQVHLPLLFEEGDEGIWARVATLDAGDKRGSFFRPEVDDEVVVGFLSADPRSAVVLGMLNSSQKPAPVTPEDDKNNIKGFYTRSEIELSFDDEKKIVTLKTPSDNSLTMSEEDKSVVVKDQNGNQITLDENGVAIKDKNNNKATLDSGGITLDSCKDINIKAKGNIQLDAVGDCVAKGMNVTLDAKTQFTGKGNAGAEVSTSAVAILKGSLVKIN